MKIEEFIKPFNFWEEIDFELLKKQMIEEIKMMKNKGNPDSVLLTKQINVLRCALSLQDMRVAFQDNKQLELLYDVLLESKVFE